MNTHPNNARNETSIYEALACPYHYWTLEYLVDGKEDVATVEEIAANLRDNEVSENRSRIVVLLHHVTLPKLSALGFIEYDDRSRTVRYRELPVLEQKLRRVPME